MISVPFDSECILDVLLDRLVGADYASIVHNQVISNNNVGIRLRVDSTVPVLLGNTLTGNGSPQVWNETLAAIIR